MNKPSYLAVIKNRIKTRFGSNRLDKLVKRGLAVGTDCTIQGDVSIDPDHCWHITIGNNVTLGPRVQIFAHDASTKRHLGYTRIGKVDIGDRVFVGAGTIILPGIEIGHDSIIGAGSVVTRSIPAEVIATGNPATVIARLDSFLESHKRELEQLPIFGREFQAATITDDKKRQMNEMMVGRRAYVK